MKTNRLGGSCTALVSSLCIVIFTASARLSAGAAYPAKLGDLVADNQPTPLDLARLINHLNGTPRLSPEWAVFADMNQDGAVNETDADLLADAVVGNTALPDVPLNRPYETSPGSGESGIAVTRETVFRLVQPLGTNALVTTTNLYAEFGGRRLLCRCELSSDRRTVTLFYLENLPGSARVRVTFNGSGLTDFLGRPLDLDGDGQPGGAAKVDFDTLSLSPLAGTAVIGHVFASDPIPSPGGEGQGEGGQTNFLNRPLAAVTITVDGMEQDLRAVTDTNGFFRLEPVPPGHFFVHIDGRTAAGSQWPNGSYYPVVGKSWDAVAGQTNTLAGGSGEIFLPFVTVGTLKTVSATNDTLITFPPSVLSNNPALAGVSITVPANSLFSENGNRGGRVGIAPVPPDRLPGPLPPGLEFPLVITVQTDGAGNFDRPVPACFPNLPDPVIGQPLPPGTKNWLYSFNHDTGEWEAIGPMTVSDDGMMICTDAGVGMIAPGWHGSGPPPSEPPPPEPPKAPCMIDADEDAKCVHQCGVEFNDRNIKCGIDAGVGLADCARGGPFFIFCITQVMTDFAICMTQSDRTYSACLFQCGIDHLCFEPDLPASRAGRLQTQSDSRTASITLTGDETSDHILIGLTNVVTLLSPFLDSQIPVPIEVQMEISNRFERLDSEANGSAFDYLSVAESRSEELLPPVEETHGNAPPYPTYYSAEIRRPDGSMLVLRGMTSAFGQYSIFVPRNGVLRRVQFFDSRAKKYGFVFPRRRPISRFSLPRCHLITLTSEFRDFDGDGIADVAERVIGTNPSDPDTDQDGIKDGPEVDAGTDPLDGLPARTGILNTVRTPGPALDVCAINDIAIVAQGNSGVALVNVVNGQNPIIIAQVDTPGFAQSVTCSGNLIAVADGAAGLAIIDVTDPPAARIVRQLNLGNSVTTVASGGGIAYAGLASGQLVAVDMATGTILATLNAGGAIHDLGLAGDSLFVLRSDQLRAYSLTGGFLDFQGSVSVSGIPAEGITGRKRLFVGSRIAYATSYPGYDTIDVSNPANLRRIGSAQDVGPNSFKQIVDNGSGLGVAAVGVNPREDGTHDVSLYDVSNPTNTTRFLTQFPTPGLTRALSIYNGLAYVADGSSGLHVVNYRAYDAQGVPPTITLTTSFPPGVAEEGKLMRLTATVSDDVQVRNVEFYVDGVRVLTDGNFPFEHRFITPFKTATKTNFTIQAKATDTGGNFTWTSNLVINLVPDATPPRVVRVAPVTNSMNQSVGAIAVFFSEPVTTDSLNSTSYSLLAAGSDGQFGTADDAPVNGVYEFRQDINAAFLNLSSNLADGLYRATLLTNVTDFAGNRLGTNVSWQFRVGPCAALPLNAIDWWTGEGSGLDSLGANHGTVVGDVQYVQGKVGVAFNFNGGGAVDVPNSASLQALSGNAAMTAELWIYQTASPGIMHYFGKRSGCGSGGNQMQLAYDSRGLHFWGTSVVFSGMHLPLFQWQHVAVTCDGTILRIYVNGVLRGSTAGTLGPANNVPLRIGASGSCGNSTHGMIDELTFYNRALSQAEIQEIIAADNLGKCRDMVVISPKKASWKYLEDGSDQGTNWVKTNFVDTAWSSGPASLGYGDGDEATVVSFGSDSNNKFITTYFRRSFSVTSASTYTNLTLRLLRDDGAVVYLNGVEAFRSNLSAGPITFTTLASADISGAAENTFVTATLNPALLVNGTNVLAVEVHQSSPTSDDLSFDLELIGIRTP